MSSPVNHASLLLDPRSKSPWFKSPLISCHSFSDHSTTRSLWCVDLFYAKYCAKHSTCITRHLPSTLFEPLCSFQCKERWILQWLGNWQRLMLGLELGNIAAKSCSLAYFHIISLASSLNLFPQTSCSCHLPLFLQLSSLTTSLIFYQWAFTNKLLFKNNLVCLVHPTCLLSITKET